MLLEPSRRSLIVVSPGAARRSRETRVATGSRFRKLRATSVNFYSQAFLQRWARYPRRLGFFQPFVTVLPTDSPAVCRTEIPLDDRATIPTIPPRNRHRSLFSRESNEFLDAIPLRVLLDRRRDRELEPRESRDSNLSSSRVPTGVNGCLRDAGLYSRCKGTPQDARQTEKSSRSPCSARAEDPSRDTASKGARESY